jgi:hypothetical protein
MLNSIALLITDNVTVDSQRDSRVAVSQLPLHDSRRNSVNGAIDMFSRNEERPFGTISFRE